MKEFSWEQDLKEIEPAKDPEAWFQSLPTDIMGHFSGLRT
jgi:hypothetical protein